MNPTLVPIHKQAPATAPTCSFAVRHSHEMPAYYELMLKDDRGNLAHWVVPMPLKQLARRPVLLWLLATTPRLGPLAGIETGPVQLASSCLGAAPDLRSELKHGVLRLHFDGRLLRGYYRLQCLPTGCGQLWQLTPIGCV